MKQKICMGKVIQLVVQANKSKDIYKTMEHFKHMSRTSEKYKSEYREALLQLGLPASDI